MGKIIFHVDMDSYFASVEQQANPHLRGRAVVVSGKEGSRTVIVAASKEAKKFGVKTAMATFEARKLCPHLYFVEPDGDKYVVITERLLTIFKKYTDKVELYSIDEVFLDLTGFIKDFSAGKKVALNMKQEIRNTIGEWLTCSFGVASNKFLAKVGSDLKKPDGLVVIDESNKIKILDALPLKDFWGIGRRLVGRLDSLGIENTRKLRDYPLEYLVREFGPHTGNVLHLMARGDYEGEVVPDFEEPEIKSVSRSYTLPYDTLDKREIFKVLMHLSESAARHLRGKILAGKTLEFYLRFQDFTHGGCRHTLKSPINDGLAIYNEGIKILNNYRLPKAVRLVGVRISNLTPASNQLSLWLPERQRLALVPYLDEINKKFGDLTIRPARLAASRLRRKVGGFRYSSD